MRILMNQNSSRILKLSSIKNYNCGTMNREQAFCSIEHRKYGITRISSWDELYSSSVSERIRRLFILTGILKNTDIESYFPALP